jgi:pimeloyl-ACP methyl ester carboxylesterase
MNLQPVTSRLAGIAARDVLIASDTAGIELFLRNKRATNAEPLGSLLLVHGATFSSVSLFDVDVGGASFMDVLAQAGIDVWALDIRGYGGSTRPNEMRQPPSPGTPLVRAVDAAVDVASAIAHIRNASGPIPVGLLGMSWGGSVAGLFASRHPGLDALILVAPLWLSDKPLRFDAGAPLMTHREIEVGAFREAWLGSAPERARSGLLPGGWFDRWCELTAATDAGAGRGYVRAPGGAVADVREHWTAAKPLYDPAVIDAPTLVIRGTWDVDVRRDMALDLFDRLTGASERAYVEVASGTHMMLMEPVRRLAFAQIVAFTTSAFERARSG